MAPTMDRHNTKMTVISKTTEMSRYCSGWTEEETRRERERERGRKRERERHESFFLLWKDRSFCYNLTLS